ncbi:class I SAM-dependent methyltransferase [Cryptosporangium minutisporangium]|uniref:Methyltransferase type 11 domain-containing protein n=1 Tax=Cryptosporangium minutisporangium TaxID=113569 RepID=A0ABP6T430_9ACTN
MVDAEWAALTETQQQRWSAVLRCLSEVVPAGATVVVGGVGAEVFAERLAAVTSAADVLVGGSADVEAGGAGLLAAADVVVRLRGGPPGADRAEDADIVVDLRDPAWPVIRRVADRLSTSDRWHLTESRAFFAAKASTWDRRFGDDLPAYAVAVAEAGFRPGGLLVDVGCGTGRALPSLRSAVGPDGVVVGLDLTPEMLAEARARSVTEHASLVLADACRLPFADASADGVFAAGLLMHLPDPDAGLRELARITRPGGRLVLFHSTGRAALAARHGRSLRPDEPLAEAPLRASTADTGWRLDRYEDAAERFLAVATRT